MLQLSIAEIYTQYYIAGLGRPIFLKDFFYSGLNCCSDCFPMPAFVAKPSEDELQPIKVFQDGTEQSF